MSGNNESSKNSELESLIQSLEEYSKNKGIITAAVNPEVEEIINLTEDNLKNLNPEECLRKAFLLSGYCGYIQKIENRHRVKLRWCESMLSKMTVQHDHLFSQYMKWEQKLYTLALNDDFAKSVLSAKDSAFSNVTWIENKVRDMRRQVDALMELGRKRYS